MKDHFPEIIKKYDRACLFIVEMIVVCTKSIDYPSPFLAERRSFTVISRHGHPRHFRHPWNTRSKLIDIKEVSYSEILQALHALIRS